MAITLWLAATGVGISSHSEFILLIAVFVPFPFWIFESVYHRYQEGYSARLRAIGILYGREYLLLEIKR